MFLDGDIVIDSKELQRFVKGIQQGHQIVVNNLTWSVYLKMRPHYTTVGKFMLNRYLNKRSLLLIFNRNSTCDEQESYRETWVVEFSRSSTISSDGDV